MKRLVSTILFDIRLQFRNGFYYAAGFVALFWMLGLRQLSKENLAWLLPAFILSNLIINTFYFVAGLVLLEKGEGTLEAQVVTPLKKGEYLASKVITLTALSIIENLIIVSVSHGLGFNPFPLIIGMVLAAAIYTLVGFVSVVRYDSINEYLFPSFVYTIAFAPPFLQYLRLWESPLFYLHPLQAPLLLMQGAFQPIGVWGWVYGITYSGLWIVLVTILSQKVFHRFIIAKAGVR